MCVRASIDPLLWESEFFSQTTAKLTNIASEQSPLLKYDQLEQFSLVQAKIDAADYASAIGLMSSGFRFVEGEVDLELTLANINFEPDTAMERQQYRAAIVGDIPHIRQIATDAFRLSRFRQPWYQPTDSGRFYALWAEKAVLGQFDDHCLVIKNANQQIDGFVTLRELADKQVRIGLLAVAKGSTGQGIGKALMQAAIHWSYCQSMSRLWVATQIANVAALRLYISAGATIANTSYWFYREPQCNNSM